MDHLRSVQSTRQVLFFLATLQLSLLTSDSTLPTGSLLPGYPPAVPADLGLDTHPLIDRLLDENPGGRDGHAEPDTRLRSLCEPAL